MSYRPPPATHEEDIYRALLAAMSRAGRQVDFDACVALAQTICQYGHDCGRARYDARAMGLNPDYLPRRRE